MDLIGDYLAELGASMRARGLDPTTYRASRRALARRCMVDAVLALDRKRVAALRRAMRDNQPRRPPSRQTQALERLAAGHCLGDR